MVAELEAEARRERERRALVRALYLGLALVALGLGLYRLPISDGLRHVGLAFGAARSWGEVYPHSAFAELGGFNPWAGFDRVLRGLAALAAQLPLSPLAQRLAVVKLLAVGWLLGLCLLSVRRARLEQAVTDPLSLGCAFAVVAGMLGLALDRAGTIRPFVIGTLVLVYAVDQRGFVRGALSSAVVIAAYPYLSFVYTGPLVVAHALRGSRSFALGAAVVTALALALAPSGQWTMLARLAEANVTRAATGVQIGELRSAASAPWLIALLVLLLVVVVPRLPASSRTLRLPHVLAACFVPAAMLHVRYLLDVVLVLLFVAHGADLTRLLRGWASDTWARWGALLPAHAESTAAPGPARGAGVVRALLLLGYAACALALAAENLRQQRELSRRADELSSLPPGARVLTEFNLQYPLLFVRPDLELVPSCELGVPSARVREPYLAYFTRGRVCELAHAVGAGHFVGSRARYLDPTDTACLRAHPSSARGPDPTLQLFRVER